MGVTCDVAVKDWCARICFGSCLIVDFVFICHRLNMVVCFSNDREWMWQTCVNAAATDGTFCEQMC